MTLAKKLGGKACRHRWQVETVYRGNAPEPVERCMLCCVTRPLRMKGDGSPKWGRWRV